MKKMILLLLVPAFCIVTGQAKADFTFGEPVNLKSIIPALDPAHDAVGCLSYDGLEMYIISGSGFAHDNDLRVLRRGSKDEVWGPPESLGPIVNSPSPSDDDSGPSISADGLTLYFHSTRPGGHGSWDIYMTTRATKNDPWGPPANCGAKVNSYSSDAGPWISPDGLELYFHSWRAPGYGKADIWVARRANTTSAWAQAVNLGSVVNSADNEFWPGVSRDGLLFVFSSYNNRAGGYGGEDIWMRRRSTISDPWQSPVNCGPKVNISAYDDSPRISPDGCFLYFCTVLNWDDPGTWDNWQAPIVPIVDFNGDGIVDAGDMCIMVDHWQTDYPLCDIGPMPWGDGIVNVQDLIVLAEHLFEVYPSAETVEVNEDNNGGQVELELGKLLVVTLVSNPSTGYRWELVENNESILKQFGQVEFKSSETSEQPIVGAGGWEIFRFKAVNAGQTTLELIYHRSWEDAEPLKTFSIQVTVN